MQKTINKIGAISLVLLFLLLGLSTISALPIQDKCTTPVETCTTALTTQTVTLLRHAPSGIFPVKVELQLEEDQSLSDAIFEKCCELAQNDQEILDFLNGSGFNLSLVSFIQSRGRGFHFDFKIRIPMKKLYEIYPNVPPHYKVIKFPIVIGRYAFDNKAKTITSSVIGGRNSINGSHSVMAIGFYGYTGWMGMVSYRGFLIRNGFAGFTLLNKVTEI